MSTDVRPGAPGDLPALLAVYNHYVTDTWVTFDVEPLTIEQRLDWFAAHPLVGPHRLLVAHDGDDVVGYVTSSPFRAKAAYRTSVETSVYLRPDATGRGLGRLLYAALFEALASEDVHRAFAGIALPNDASVALHTALGVQRRGHLRRGGLQGGRVPRRAVVGPARRLTRPPGVFSITGLLREQALSDCGPLSDCGLLIDRAAERAGC